MDLLGQRVIHSSSSLGEGKIISFDKATGKLEVEFPTKTLSFQSPYSFEKYLTCVDSALQEELQQLIRENKAKLTPAAPPPPPPAPPVPPPKAPHHGKPPAAKGKTPCIAFKLNYCDGGETKADFGFCGVCSEEQIDTNIRVLQRTWCSQWECPCRQYYEGELTYDELCQDYWDDEPEGAYYPCGDSRVFRDLAMDVENRKRPSETLPGHLAVLTTQPPGSSGRIVIAMFIIDSITYNAADNFYSVWADKNYFLRFTKKEAAKILFWDYHLNPGNPASQQWGSGPYRFFNDQEALRFLEGAIAAAQNKQHRQAATDFLAHYKEINHLA